MPVGRRLPMYCTASGRAYLSALPPSLARRILGRSRAAALTPTTLTDPQQIWKRVAAARESGYAWSDQEYYRGDLTIAAPILGEDGQPLAAVNISAPTSRWTLAQLRAKLAPLLLQSAQAASPGYTVRSQRRVAK
jgi:DNA-binding IclR family transcriptional regulator